MSTDAVTPLCLVTITCPFYVYLRHVNNPLCLFPTQAEPNSAMPDQGLRGIARRDVWPSDRGLSAG